MESFHYLSMSNHMMIQKQLMEQLKPYGLTLGQPKVLDYLKNHDGANRMEDQNMVERRILNGNRRSFHVFLTKNGRRLQQIVEQKFHEIEAVALAGISEEDLNFFLKTFQKVQDNLSSQNSSDK